jgi:propionyl-CoA carboxylase alpha chain
MFDKILIANRGEIAVRVMKTCKRMGIGVVAVYSEADARSPHVREADESVFIGASPAGESYLAKEKLVSAAKANGCQAVHPGYGFLSENADFARMVIDESLSFVGPSASAISLLGDKVASKALALRAGLPIVPGYDKPINEVEEARSIAKEIGFPLLLKPAAGGGGRGMRIISCQEDFVAALSECREETKKAFADDRIFMEKFISKPRHIEIQIMADQHGNVISLPERDCTIQRRYQKVIEETPSPAMDESLRERMGLMACALTKEAGYCNAGTVEFIMDQDRNFYFLEMNTRLQVEHPITELVSSLDLVELQLRVAAGEALPVKQHEVQRKGWAIEARICAEDPERGFFPTTGIVTRYAAPKGNGVRVDAGVAPGSVIGIYYDSLLAKVSAWGEDREEARRTLVRALNGYHIEGIVTNVDFANALLMHPVFAHGEFSTDFIERHFQDGRSYSEPPLERLHRMAIASALVYHTRQGLVRESLKPMSPLVGSLSHSVESRDYYVKVDQNVFNLHLEGDQVSRQWEVFLDGEPYEVITPEFEYYRRRLVLKINGQSNMFRLQYHENHIKVSFCGTVTTFEIYSPAEWGLAGYMIKKAQQTPDNVLKCPMPGLVTSVYARAGEYARKGQELVRMESMKMETGIASPCDGMIENVLVEAGQTVDVDETLVIFATQ